MIQYARVAHHTNEEKAQLLSCAAEFLPNQTQLQHQEAEWKVRWGVVNMNKCKPGNEIQVKHLDFTLYIYHSAEPLFQ